jgi:hypothetical protein
MKFFPQLFLNLGKKVWPNMQQDVDLDVEKYVEPDVEVETTATLT